MHILVLTVRVRFVHNARQKCAISCFGRSHRPIRSFRFICGAVMPEFGIQTSSIFHIPHLRRRSAAARFITIKYMKRGEENMFAIQAAKWNLYIFNGTNNNDAFVAYYFPKTKIVRFVCWFFWVSFSSFTSRHCR